MAKTTYPNSELSLFKEGIEVTVQQHDIATVDLSRLTKGKSGILYIGNAKDSVYPTNVYVGLYYFDIGGSAILANASGSSSISADLDVVWNTTLTGTTGTDGRVTISVSNNSNNLTIEYRGTQSSWTFNVKVIA